MSNSSDTNTISMTQDLYFSHISSMAGVTVDDMRTVQYDADLSKETLSKHSGMRQETNAVEVAFYAELLESDTVSGSWQCLLHAINLLNDSHIVKQNDYDSYYKILLDAKSLSQQAIEEAAASSKATVNASPARIQDASLIKDMQSLFGTWKGEEYIDKIVIMRGGRGFVIYNNGASMSITVTLQADLIQIVQASSSNASYFPELPREDALSVAANAPAIRWDMALTQNGELKGKKTTLALVDGKVELKEIEVSWQRQ